MAKKRTNRKPAGTQEEDRLERYAKEMRIKAMQRRPLLPSPDAIKRAQELKEYYRQQREKERVDAYLRQKASAKSPPPAARDPLAGRTVEAGTRSIREGLRSWMRDLRGGGGSRLTGR